MKIITKSKITEFMAGHPKLVSAVVGVGISFAVAAAFSMVVGSLSHDAYAKLCMDCDGKNP